MIDYVEKLQYVVVNDDIVLYPLADRKDNPGPNGARDESKALI